MDQEFAPHRPRAVCYLMDGMWSHDVASIIQVFGSTLAIGGIDPCDLEFVAEGECSELDHGISIRTTPIDRFDGTAELICIPGFVNPFAIDERLERAGVSIADVRRSVSGGQPTQRLSPAARAWLCGRHATGSEIVTLGTGIFVPAVAGLLDGVRCTTHWEFAESLSRGFPHAEVDASRMLAYDEHARIRSSAGGASGVDVCLAALVDIAGHAAASSIAGAMNLWSPRSLAARQDAFGMARTVPTDDPVESIEQLKDAVHGNIAHSWSVSEMARYAGMSVRTFQRHFQRAMGETPARWIIRERLNAACELLEETDLPLPLVAVRTGFSSADLMRRRFQDLYGLSPSAYRKHLRVQGMRMA